jgi:hypothetical protein
LRIPPDLLPESGQIPFWIDKDADRERFKLVFAITRRFLGRDDPVFTRELFASDMPTGDLSSLPDSDPPEHLGFDLEPAG